MLKKPSKFRDIQGQFLQEKGAYTDGAKLAKVGPGYDPEDHEQEGRSIGVITSLEGDSFRIMYEEGMEQTFSGISGVRRARSLSLLTKEEVQERIELHNRRANLLESALQQYSKKSREPEFGKD